MGCPEGVQRSLEAHPEVGSVTFDIPTRTFTLVAAPGRAVSRDELGAWIADAAKARHEAWRLAED